MIPVKAAWSVSISGALRLATFFRRRSGVVPGDPEPGVVPGSGDVAVPSGYPLTIQFLKVCERSALHFPAVSGGISAFGGAVWVNTARALRLTPSYVLRSIPFAPIWSMSSGLKKNLMSAIYVGDAT